MLSFVTRRRLGWALVLSVLMALPALAGTIDLKLVRLAQNPQTQDWKVAWKGTINTNEGSANHPVAPVVLHLEGPAGVFTPYDYIDDIGGSGNPNEWMYGLQDTGMFEPGSARFKSMVDIYSGAGVWLPPTIASTTETLSDGSWLQ